MIRPNRSFPSIISKPNDHSEEGVPVRKTVAPTIIERSIRYTPFIQHTASNSLLMNRFGAC